MAQYYVNFIQSYSYSVEAEDEEEAFNKAYDEFDSDMHRPIAHTDYDEYHVYEVTEDGTEIDTGY